LARHSVVLPSAACSRASGTLISTFPKVPISVQGRPPMPVANDTSVGRTGLLGVFRRPPVTRPCQRCVKLLTDQLFDEAADTYANLNLNRVKRGTAVSVCECKRSDFVVTLLMAWSPVRRFNAG
jgi:hypothetical protein